MQEFPPLQPWPGPSHHQPVVVQRNSVVSRNENFLEAGLPSPTSSDQRRSVSRPTSRGPPGNLDWMGRQQTPGDGRSMTLPARIKYSQDSLPRDITDSFDSDNSPRTRTSKSGLHEDGGTVVPPSPAPNASTAATHDWAAAGHTATATTTTATAATTTAAAAATTTTRENKVSKLGRAVLMVEIGLTDAKTTLKRPSGAPKTSQRQPQNAPKAIFGSKKRANEAQESSKTNLEALFGRSRGPKELPRAPQEPPKSSQKEAERAPKLVAGARYIIRRFC